MCQNSAFICIVITKGTRLGISALGQLRSDSTGGGDESDNRVASKEERRVDYFGGG